MIWLNPLALIGVVAVVAPILIHILVQRRAERFPFPTLRFLQPTRLASIRRHVLEDPFLLAVRAAILVVSTFALAGPLLVTQARRAVWNTRIARAVVIDEVARTPAPPDVARRLQPSDRIVQATFNASDLRDGIARATAWLDTAPPARRELLIVSTFVLGSIDVALLRDVPQDVGIRFERSGQPPAARSFAGTPVLEADLVSRAVHQRDRTIDLDGPFTSVRESSAERVVVPIEIDATADVKRTAEATLTAVLSQRVLAPVADRGARVIFATALPPAGPPSASLPTWIADAIARITTDMRMRSGADPLPIAVSSDGSRLLVTTTLPPADLRTALLFRSVFDALAVDNEVSANHVTFSPGARALAEREILTVPDTDLRRWERPSRDVRSPRLDTIDRDDRRWWWAAALFLLILETAIRRSRQVRHADEKLSDVA